MLTEFKRVKHGQQPGDVPKRTKIAMREKFQEIGKAAKAFRRYLSEKSRTVQRRRDRRAYEREMEKE